MTELIFFGVGSPLVFEYEETCRRLGWTVPFGIRNFNSPDMCSDAVLVRMPDDLRGLDRQIPCIIPLFTPRNRASAVTEARALGLNLATRLIDPTAIIASDSALGNGCFVNAGTVIGAASRLGDHISINRNCSIGHHNALGEFVSIGPGSTTCGNVTIGAHTFIGAGSVILPSVTIGRGAVIGAGSVIASDVASHTKIIQKRDQTVTLIANLDCKTEKDLP